VLGTYSIDLINILYLASIGMVSSKLTLTAEQAGFSSSSFEKQHNKITNISKLD
jgi:hypothetical protein